ncbi:hypothetical protein AB1Y20_015126 [Prymnesium parvum]|uniref:Prokaryotic-type class I peptide chain release factors domain-containing protein n=1 Tax=Prymnesium parvum TaxID=97485 RepID=A0AB34JXI7_PRYPA
MVLAGGRIRALAAALCVVPSRAALLGTMRLCDPPHPASRSADALRKECDLTHTRGSGPGGQHRNKVSTAVVLRHTPTGLVGKAAESRSQTTNYDSAMFRLRIALALQLRSPPPRGGGSATATPAIADKVAAIRAQLGVDPAVPLPAAVAEASRTVGLEGGGAVGEVVDALLAQLAIEMPPTVPTVPPSELWAKRCKGGKMNINENHEDFPTILAEALDRIWATYDVRCAAQELGISQSQLVKLLKKEPQSLVLVNRLRAELGIPPLN